MSDLDIAVKWSKRFEAVLDRRYGAHGRGLHEKLDSVEHDLPGHAVRDLRLVATVRNKIVHEDGYSKIDRKREFIAACHRAEKAMTPRGVRWRMRIYIVLGLLAAFGVLALMQGLSIIQIFPRLH